MGSHAIPLFIGSTNGNSGKTLLSIVLGRLLQQQGYGIGYIRVLGKSLVFRDNRLYDMDAEIVRKALGLEDHVERMSPILLTQDLVASVLEGKAYHGLTRFKESYREVSAGKDVMLINGAPDLYEGLMMGISSLMVIKALDAPTVLLDPYRDEVCVDCILSAKESLGKRLAGVILGMVSPDGMEHTRNSVAPYLEKQGIKVFGIVPRMPILESVTVKQISEAIDGEVLSGQDRLDALVENIVVGAMDVESALRYFIKKKNKAVITGANRADIITAALETSTKCLVLTGDILPNEIVLGRARTMDVPVVHVKDDTLSTITKLESIMGKIRVVREDQIKKAHDIAGQYIDMKALFRAAGITVK